VLCQFRQLQQLVHVAAQGIGSVFHGPLTDRQREGFRSAVEGLIWKGRYREVSSVMRNPASRSQKALSNSTLSYTSKDA
jgi:hypothetical protein